MQTTFIAIPRMIMMTIIILSISLLSQKVNGQSPLKKLRDKVAKEIYDKTHQKFDTSNNSNNSQKNLPNNSVATPTHNSEINNTNIPKSIPKEVPDEIHLVPGTMAEIHSFVNPVICNNKLYFINHAGQNNNLDDWQLIEYNDSNVKVIPLRGLINDFNGISLEDTIVVSNNKLYVPVYGQMPFENRRRYTNILIEYDGANLSLIPKPDLFDIKHPFSYNGHLYCIYVDHREDPSPEAMSMGIGSLAEINGTKINIIPSESAGINRFDFFYESAYKNSGFPFLYKNKMYFPHYAPFSLLEFDGKKLRYMNIVEPSLYNIKAVAYHPIVNNNRLYFQYEDGFSPCQFAEFDGFKMNLIPNPDGGRFDPRRNSSAFVYNNKLYCEYITISGRTQLVQFEVSKFTFIPDPGKDTRDFNNSNYSKHTFYDNKEIFLESNMGRPVVEYDGSSFVVIPSPEKEPSPLFPIVYHNTIYGSLKGHTGRYNVNELNFITNNNHDYIEFNGKLYFLYTKPYKPQLAYLDKEE